MIFLKIVNPVLKGFNPDPSICRVGDDYYIATSTFEWFPGVQIHHSKDLVNWRLLNQPLNRIDLLDMRGNPDSGGVWAPQLSYADGKFWLVYSNIRVVEGSWKDGYNYLTTAETIDGEWEKPILLNGSGFDPSLFHDEGGKKYLLNMYWDPRPDKHPFYGIEMTEYDSDKKKLVGSSEIIYRGTDWGLVEAPHLYKKEDYYYLLTAEGGTGFEHAAMIARSKSIDGPYEKNPDNPLITSYPYPTTELQKAGHGSFVETQNGEWYFAHLMARPIQKSGTKGSQNRGYSPLGRETAIQKVEWKENWPYIINGNRPHVEVEAPDLPERKWRQDYLIKDDFNISTLNRSFQTLRVPFNEIGSLSARKSHLRLYGKESFRSQFVQALVARRWQSLNFEAETKVEFEAETIQQQAGLVCYYNTKNWTSIHVTWDEKYGKVIDMTSSDRLHTTRPMGGKVIPIPKNIKAVYFKVKVEKAVYQFSYSFDGKTWILLKNQFDSYKLSDDYIREAGFFTGAFVGMSCIDLTGFEKPADFDYFRYEELEEK